MDIVELYKKQISLTEWYEQLDYPEIQKLREEDNRKRERLAVISDVTGLPFDRPRQFAATDIAEKSPEFEQYLQEHGSDLCALRLIPRNPALPKLRMRGHTVHDVLAWFAEQKIDPAQYTADIVPHSEQTQWATIFIVNQQGMFGEIIAGGHHQLTQGFYESVRPIQFSFDFQTWTLSEENSAVREELDSISRYLCISDLKKQMTLKEKVHAVFSHDYLNGYFETVSSHEFGLWFIDYNRILGDLYTDVSATVLPSSSKDVMVKGQTGCAGFAKGHVRIIAPEAISTATLKSDDILVCDMTSPEYLPLMKQAAGIITDRGGMLCHAAIISRELKKPCIVSTGNATKVLKDGEMIEMDARKGTVWIVGGLS